MKKDHDLINTKLAVAGERAADEKVNDFAANDDYKNADRVV